MSVNLVERTGTSCNRQIFVHALHAARDELLDVCSQTVCSDDSVTYCLLVWILGGGLF